MCSQGKASTILIDYTWIVDDIPYSRSKKTVTFSFCSVPWERKWNARSGGKKQSIPFRETVNKLNGGRRRTFNYLSITTWHATQQLSSSQSAECSVYKQLWLHG